MPASSSAVPTVAVQDMASTSTSHQHPYSRQPLAGPSKRVYPSPTRMPDDAAADAEAPGARSHVVTGMVKASDVFGGGGASTDGQSEEWRGEAITCNGCKLVLEEKGVDSMVVSFGNALWHVDCFRCARCRSLVEHDTNLLLLSDGSPICERCAYICSVCKLSVDDEAIVTGDESYHADCFRCRSCDNRIEELIFARTSQGIYCMACHNDRVARGRRHAEAKRNKSLKKDHRPKDRSLMPEGSPLASGSGSGSGSSRRARAVQSGSQPATPLSEGTSAQFSDPGTSGSLRHLEPPPVSPPITSADSDGAFPSPALNSATGATMVQARQQSISAGAGAVEQRQHGGRRTSADVVSPVSSPSKARERRANSFAGSGQPHPGPEEGRGPHGGTPEGSGSSVLGSALLPEQPHARQGRGGANPAEHARTFPPPGRKLAPGSSAAQARPSTADDGRPSLDGEWAGSPLARPFDSSPALGNGFVEHRREASKDGGSGLKPQGLGPEGAGARARANRRSGFYGLQMGAPAGEEPADRGSGPGHREGGGRLSSESDDKSSSPTTPPLATTVTFATPDRPLSFYDPDTLHLLDAVASPDRKPSMQVPPASAQRPQPEAPPVASPEVEHLSITPDEEDGEEDEEDEKAVELTRRVRQSIGASRQTSIGLDVGMVESLLSELDMTKNKMKSLQTQYNAMKRASHTAFQGFTLAREEYDREVEARREAETQMAELKAKMMDQAGRLAAADTLQSLRQESQKLRSSVDGLHRTLSVLTVERDIKVAEVESLQTLDLQGDSAAASTAALPRSLSARLEVIKQGYRAQIDELAGEKASLQQEVAHLRKVRDAQVVEFEELNRKSDALAARNAEAQWKLDDANALYARLQGSRPPPSRKAHKGGHVVQSPSLPSVNYTASASASPHLPAADPPHGPGPDPEVAMATSRRFKWGKNGAAQKHAALAPAVARGPHPAHRANASVSVSELSAGSGSGIRPHNFQPVSVLRPVRCDFCGDKLWGLAEVRCHACGSYCHSKCAPMSFGCYGGSGGSSHAAAAEEPEPEGPSMFGNDLAAQSRSEGGGVPLIVTKCIEAVEHDGLSFEGIYRKSGGMSAVKMVQTCFDRGAAFDLHDVDRFNDISAVTSALKNYFRQLPNPLFTYELHESFISACSTHPETARIEALERIVYQLPPAHFHTLSALMRHLHRIHLASSENKMTPQNLGVVFGPTLLRSRDVARSFSDMPFTAKVVELMVENTEAIFWKPLGAGVGA